MKVDLSVIDFLDRAETVFPDRVVFVDEPDQIAESWGEVTGAEFARELVWVLVRAAIAGATTMTGAPGELLVILHRQGHLRTLPSDQVGRDALKILAVHTPLVRRIHYRRWCLAFGDLLDAESPLRVELRRYESA